MILFIQAIAVQDSILPKQIQHDQTTAKNQNFPHNPTKSENPNFHKLPFHQAKLTKPSTQTITQLKQTPNDTPQTIMIQIILKASLNCHKRTQSTQKQQNSKRIDFLITRKRIADSIIKPNSKTELQQTWECEKKNNNKDRDAYPIETTQKKDRREED